MSCLTSRQSPERIIVNEMDLINNNFKESNIMKNENGFMGQVDLLALLGAELKVVDSADCIVVPLKYNPSIEIYQKKNGKMSASLNLFMNDSNDKYGHSHYIRATVSKKVLDRYSMTYETAKPYCPIIGNMKPVPSAKKVEEKPNMREFNNFYSKK